MRLSACLFASLSLACTAPTAPAAPLATGGPALSAAAGRSAGDTGRGLGLTYEIYVRSFQDSDGDGIGDLEGVRTRLDHLEAMGVRTLWLMPVFPSVGPAGYDVTDFDRVRADYGDADALSALLADAHVRGMRVLLDLPFNHVARTHPWFAAAEADSAAPERDLFLFAGTQWDTHRWFPSAAGDYYYGFFGADLPDLDWTNDATRARMFDVFGAWLDAGVDGYRLDAVTTLVEADGAITNTDATHALLAELYAYAADVNPDAVFLAEAGEPDVADNAGFLGTDAAPESDRVLDFPRRTALLEAVGTGTPTPLLALLQATEEADALGRTATFVSSHDLARLPAFVPDAAARRLLMVLQLTLPGDPVLYYGEELDLADATTATGQDYAQRAPMPWDSSRNAGFSTGSAWFTLDPAYAEGRNVAGAVADPDSTLNLVRDLACVRDAIEGAAWEPVATDSAAVLAYSRATEAGRIVVVANLGATATRELRIDAHGAFQDLTHGLAGVYAADGLRIQGLPAYGYAVFAEEIAADCPVAGPV